MNDFGIAGIYMAIQLKTRLALPRLWWPFKERLNMIRIVQSPSVMKYSLCKHEIECIQFCVKLWCGKFGISEPKTLRIISDDESDGFMHEKHEIFGILWKIETCNYYPDTLRNLAETILKSLVAYRSSYFLENSVEDDLDYCDDNDIKFFADILENVNEFSMVATWQ